jgi:uncharacterized protein (DUF1778 family)
MYTEIIHTQGATMIHSHANASVSINIRAKARQRNLIDQAAEKLGRSRSEFILDAACRQAEDVLLDQTFFMVDSNTFAKLQLLLDQPLPATDKLRRLLQTKAPWDN